MKKGGLVLIVALVAVVLLFLSWRGITGFVVSQIPSFGPSQEEQKCMMSCMKCDSPGVNCTGNQEYCGTQCNAVKPEENTEQKCVSECTKKDCGDYDFSCQEKNREACDKECGMIKAPDESSMGAEQLCISNCVNAEAPGTICGNSQEGETGNELCQRCAASCIYLYAGPCLDDTKLKAKQKECETCEHCYGKPVMGDSGGGWKCVVSVECKDASEEFGDNPGTEDGVVAKVGGAIVNVASAIGNFFSNIFSG